MEKRKIMKTALGKEVDDKNNFEMGNNHS